MILVSTFQLFSGILLFYDLIATISPHFQVYIFKSQ